MTASGAHATRSKRPLRPRAQMVVDHLARELGNRRASIALGISSYLFGQLVNGGMAIPSSIAKVERKVDEYLERTFGDEQGKEAS